MSNALFDGWGRISADEKVLLGTSKDEYFELNDKELRTLSQHYQEKNCKWYNLERAVICLRVASRVNNYACVDLYDLLKKHGSSKDYAEMFQVISKSANSGHGQAVARLASVYRRGIGVEPNLKEALALSRRAVSMGVTWAQAELMSMLWEANEPESDVELVALCKAKAIDGDSLSLEYLARALRFGRGITKDPHLSSKIFARLYKSNSGFLKEYIQTLQESGSPEDLMIALNLLSNIKTDYAYHNIALILWNFSLASKNIVRKYISYVSPPIEHWEPVNPSIFDNDKICCIGEGKDLDILFSICFQNNIPIDSVVTSNSVPFPQLDLGSIDASFAYSFILFGRALTSVALPKGCTVYVVGEYDCTIINSPSYTILPLFLEKKINVQLIDDDVLAEKYCGNIDCLVEHYISHPDMTFCISCTDWKLFFNTLFWKKINRDRVCLDHWACLYSKCSVYSKGGSIYERPIGSVLFRYALGNAIYDELSADPSCKYIYHNGLHMGDQYRTLCKFNSFVSTDGKNKKLLVCSSAKDLPDLFGYDSIIVSPLELTSLSLYVQRNYLFDEGCVVEIGRECRFSDSLSLNPEYGNWKSDPRGATLGLGPDVLFDSIRPLPISKKAVEVYNSVLINPNCITLYNRRPLIKEVYLDFLQKVVDELVIKGYRVYTNVYSDDDIVLKHTCPIRYSIKEFISISPYFRYIITVETGLSELLAFTDSNVTVLYTGEDGTCLKTAKLMKRNNFLGMILDESFSVDQREYLITALLNHVSISLPRNLVHPEYFIDYGCVEWKQKRLERCWNMLYDEYPEYRELILQNCGSILINKNNV